MFSQDAAPGAPLLHVVLVKSWVIHDGRVGPLVGKARGRAVIACTEVAPDGVDRRRARQLRMKRGLDLQLRHCTEDCARREGAHQRSHMPAAPRCPPTHRWAGCRQRRWRPAGRPTPSTPPPWPSRPAPDGAPCPGWGEEGGIGEEAWHGPGHRRVCSPQRPVPTTPTMRTTSCAGGLSNAQVQPPPGSRRARKTGRQTQPGPTAGPPARQWVRGWVEVELGGGEHNHCLALLRSDSQPCLSSSHERERKGPPTRVLTTSPTPPPT